MRAPCVQGKGGAIHFDIIEIAMTTNTVPVRSHLMIIDSTLINNRVTGANSLYSVEVRPHAPPPACSLRPLRRAGLRARRLVPCAK